MAEKINKDIAVLLDVIAKHLWSGHASVMVGAGFSKNAVQNSSNSKPFLTWNQLADIFYKELHGTSPSGKEHYLNPLKLAEEVCAAFGRPALEKLMQTELPDLEYSPSDIHKDLLELPWNDVFTTNYDTLLERTKVLRRYDIVLNKSDLVFSQRPRIVKLHGSFPSHRPFIITEEDYRRFPREYAPLVNTVQQSLIENTLCLIGFSGDDPNFLSWIGWIRDNLGASSSPRIFLIGVLNLNQSQIKVLEQRNIGVIDLSSCVTSDSDKHKKALQIFIDYLKQKESEENRLDWPRKESIQSSPSSNASDEIYIEGIKSITDVWSRTRSEYPGWVICPRDSRKYLKTFTWNWTYGKHLKVHTPFGLDILFWRELAWRLDKCLCPLDELIVPLIENAISRYNPFPHRLNLQPEFNHLSSDGKFDWSQVPEAWLYLNLCLLRSYREDGLKEKWTERANILEVCLDEMSSSQKDTFRYEKCLFSLFLQDMVEFRSSLQAWKPDDSSPFFQAKKAGLLAEYGNLNEASELLESSLQIVRAQLNLSPITKDYSHLSQEAYILQLLKFVKDAKIFFSSKEEDRKYVDEYGLRWTRLKQYKCDPWGEMQLFEATLSGPFKEYKNKEVIHSFDIGRSSTTHRFGSNEEAFEAYAFLRYVEDIGSPYHIQNMSFGKDAAIGAVQRIGKTSPNWAIATLMRTGSEKAVDALFDRNALVNMPSQKVESLVDTLTNLLSDLTVEIERVSHLKEENIGSHYAGIVPEILSRLCSRCSFEQLKKMLDFILTTYNSQHRWKYSGIDNFTERLISSWPIDHLSELISRIITECPIILGKSQQIIQRHFPDPLMFIERHGRIPKKGGTIVVPPAILDKLISDFESAQDEDREAIFGRIARVFNLDLFSDAQVERISLSLWSKVNESGFPVGITTFYHWFFLNFLTPKETTACEALHGYLRNAKFPIIGTSRSIEMRSQCHVCNEFIGATRFFKKIGWTSDDSLNVLEKILEWWNTDKKVLEEAKTNNFMDRAEEISGRFQKALDVLNVAVIPFLDDISFNNHEEKIEELLREMEPLEILTIESRARIYLRKNETFNDVLSAISTYALSGNFYHAQRAMAAITIMLESDTPSLNSSDKEQLILILVDIIKWRNASAVIPALVNLNSLIQNNAVPWEKHQAAILTGILHLADESDLTKDGNTLPLHDKLVVREVTARLASTLYAKYLSKNIPIPVALERWNTICHDSEEFAEVRNEWSNDN